MIISNNLVYKYAARYLVRRTSDVEDVMGAVVGRHDDVAFVLVGNVRRELQRVDEKVDQPTFIRAQLRDEAVVYSGTVPVHCLAILVLEWLSLVVFHGDLLQLRV